VLPESC